MAGVEHALVLIEKVVELPASVLHDPAGMLESLNLAKEAVSLVELSQELMVLSCAEHDSVIPSTADGDVLLDGAGDERRHGADRPSGRSTGR